VGAGGGEAGTDSGEIAAVRERTTVALVGADEERAREKQAGCENAVKEETEEKEGRKDLAVALMGWGRDDSNTNM